MRRQLLLMLVRAVGRLSFKAAGRGGQIVGWLGCRIDNRETRTARVNLALCFPTLSLGEREVLLRQSLVETGRSLAQMLRLLVGKPLRVDDLIDENGVVEACRDRIAVGRGLIVALPHLGNWELIAYLSSRVAPNTALYRPSRLASLNGLIQQGRARSGISLVPTGRRGLRALYRALENGEIVSILPDQVPKTTGAGGVVAPFFDHPAMTMTLVSRLARRHETPVIFCCAVPEAVGSVRHRVHFFDADPQVADPDPVVAATALNRGIERCARAFPAHYQWTYRRFEIPGNADPNPYRSRD